MTVNDRQWEKIAARLKLPEAAREFIEREITWYRELDSAWRRSPSEVSRNIKRVSDTASKLADLLEGLEDRERIELIEAWPREISSLEISLGKIDAAVQRARTVSIACKNAQVSKLSQPDRVDELMGRLDEILHQFAGEGVSQSNEAIDFLANVFKAAGIKLKDRTIRFAVQRFHTRGKKHGKDFSETATESSR